MIDKSIEATEWRRVANAVKAARADALDLHGRLAAACDAGVLAMARSLLTPFRDAVTRLSEAHKGIPAAAQAYVDRLVAAAEAAKKPASSAPSSSASAPDGAPKPLVHDPSAFPAELTPEMIANGKRANGGSTGARFIEVGGRRYVCKRPSSVTGEGNVSDDCLRNEIAGDRIYRAAGIRVPDCREYVVDGKPVKLATMIEGGQSLADWYGRATPKQREEMKGKLLKGYLVDALLGNWDVCGMGGDNILIDKDGEPWRIDNGSAMGYRAQGTPKKPAEWREAEFPDEWRTLRDSANNRRYFGDFTTADIFRQKIDWDAVLAAAPASERQILERRVAEIRNVQRVCGHLDRAGEVDAAVSVELDATYDLCRDGLREAVPEVKVDDGIPDLGFFRPPSGGGSSAAKVAPADKEMGDVVAALKNAAISVNHHADSDGKPNMPKVAAALAAAKKMPELAKKGIDVSKWEKVAAELAAVSPSGQTTKVSMVEAYAPQIKVEQPKGVASRYKSLSEWEADFIMRGGDPNAPRDPDKYRFISMCSESQGSNSWIGDGLLDWDEEKRDDHNHPYTCLRKILEHEIMGRNPDPASGGDIHGFTPEQKTAYRRAWAYRTDPKNAKEMETAKEAVVRARAFTRICLERSGLPYYDAETNTILVARTESDNAMAHMTDDHGTATKQGKFGTFDERGCGESGSMFRTVVIKGNNLTVQRVPVSAVGNTFMTKRLKPNGEYTSKYLGDGENEIHVDFSFAKKCYYAGRVTGGEDLKPYFEAFLAAEKAEKGKSGGGK